VASRFTVHYRPDGAGWSYEIYADGRWVGGGWSHGRKRCAEADARAAVDAKLRKAA
jgi:hypothetical protein